MDKMMNVHIDAYIPVALSQLNIGAPRQMEFFK